MRRANDIPIAMINLRVSVAESFGADRDAILKEAKMNPEIFANPKARVSVAQTMDVWNAIANQTGSHDMGLESGLKIRLSSLGVLGYVMMNSSSLATAYEKLCTYQRLVSSIIFQSLQKTGHYTSIVGEMQEEWRGAFKYTIDFVIAGNFAIIKNSTAKDIHPVEVGFNYPKPENITRYLEIFGPAQVLFSCKAPYIKYKKADLDNRIIGNNPNMFKHFELQLQDKLLEHDQVNKYSRMVRDIIIKRLMAEIPKVGDVAREMTMSVRSLQSNLKEEGTSYQIILNAVRKEISMNQLKNTNFNISDVAFLTGFSDLSVFSRNFKKWTGLTPSQYQAQL